MAAGYFEEKTSFSFILFYFILFFFFFIQSLFWKIRSIHSTGLPRGPDF